jgi:hypothetical protein
MYKKLQRYSMPIQKSKFKNNLFSLGMFTYTYKGTSGYNTNCFDS